MVVFTLLPKDEKDAKTPGQSAGSKDDSKDSAAEKPAASTNDDDVD